MSKRQETLVALTQMGIDFPEVEKELAGIDIEKEMELIVAKKSSLSNYKRKLVKAVWVKMQNKALEATKEEQVSEPVGGSCEI